MLAARTTELRLLEAVAAIQRLSLLAGDFGPALHEALRLFLRISGSEYGLIGEVLYSPDGSRCLRSSSVAADEPVREPYGSGVAQDLDCETCDTLLAALVRERRPVIDNAPGDDLRAAGFPPGHPPLRALLGLPFSFDGAVVGAVLLANRPEGYDQQLAADWQPLCDALGAIIAAAGQKRLRGEAESALEESRRSVERMEQRLRTLSDFREAVIRTAAEGITVCFPIPVFPFYRFVVWNDRMVEMTGYSREEINRLGWYRTLYPDPALQAQAVERASQVLAGEDVRDEEWQITRKDGARRTLAMSTSHVALEDGTQAMVCLVHDVTEPRRLAREATEREERFRALVEHGYEGITVVDAAGAVLYASPANERLMGYASAEIPGRWGPELIHDGDRGAAQAALAAVVERPNEVVSVDLRLRHRAGDWRWLECRVCNLLENPAVAGIVVNWRDVTPRKAAEAALRESTRFNQQIVSCANVGIVGLDAELRYVLWNPCMEQLTGVSAEEVLGRRPRDAFPFLERMGIPPLIERALHGEEVRAAEMQFHRRGSDETFWASVAHMPLRDAEGAIQGVLAIVQEVTQRKLAEQALEDTRRRLALIPRGANVGLWDWDLATNAVSFSTEWKSQLGYADDEIDGRLDDWRDRVHPDDLPGALAIVRDTIDRCGADYDVEFRMRHKDGSWRWILSRGFVLAGPDGRGARMLGIHLDITERKQAEAALQASEIRYRMFVDHATDGLFIHDRRGRVVDANLQSCASLGYTREELIGMSPLEFDPELTPDMLAGMQEKLEAGITLSFDSRHRRQDGSEFPVEIRLRPFWVDGERFALALAHDLTERKRAEDALREAESRWRTMLEDLENVAVQAYSPAGTITFWNKASERLYGFAASEAVGRDFVELLHDETTRGHERRIMDEALRTGRLPPAEEIPVALKDGRKAWIVASRVLHAPPGRPPEFFCFDVDITDRKRAEEELAARRAELLHASRLSTVGEMMAALAHEVAQPVSAIGNFASAGVRILAAESPADLSLLGQYVRAISQQNERCGAIVQRIRDFSRRALPRRSACDLPGLLRDSVELIRNELRNHGVSVEFDLAGDLPVLCADRVQIQQVLVNLLSNARDAVRMQNADRRHIVVRARSSTEAIAIDVVDRGIGLTEDVASRLFEPFFTTKENGLGMGLSICQTIVREHGGTIQAIRQTGPGATFRVRLPLTS